MLYLPKSKNLDEVVAFFDYTNSFDINYIDRESLKERRLVSLSNYGFYILLLKLYSFYKSTRKSGAELIVFQ